jgi:hypothetical protein
VGSFQPRTLKVDGLEKFDGSQLHYRVKNPAQFAGKNLVIVGGGDSALDWALNFAQDGPHKAESVILLHRRDGFRAAPASVAKMRELCEAYEMQFIIGQVTGFDESDDGLLGREGHRRRRRDARVPLDMLLVFFGLSPKLGPIAEWGLGIERKQIVVDTEKFQTNDPGHLRGGRHQHLPGQEEAHPVGLPRGGAGRLRRRAHRLPGKARAACCSTPPPAPSCTRCWAWSRRSSTDRYGYRELAQRSRQLAQALQRLGVRSGDRVATLAWNGYRHLELYYAVSGSGAVLHTSIRACTPIRSCYIADHAEDQVLCFDLSFLPLVQAVAPRLPDVATSC